MGGKDIITVLNNSSGINRRVLDPPLKVSCPRNAGTQ